jgi:hypothetical protein
VQVGLEDLRASCEIIKNRVEIGPCSSSNDDTEIVTKKRIVRAGAFACAASTPIQLSALKEEGPEKNASDEGENKCGFLVE